MAVLCEQVNLAGYTTLRLGGPARRFVEATTDDELVGAVRKADETGEDVLVLGGGSNLVVADEGFPGTVVHVATRGVTVTYGTDRVLVRAQAGEEWEPFVARCVDEGLAGVECLSGIPGRLGATPIQNVGAYGQDVSETIVEVRAYDRENGEVVTLDRDACRFAYRSSVFKGSGRYVVLEVAFALEAADLSTPVRYAELARTLGVEPGERVPLKDAREAVLALRARQGHGPRRRPTPTPAAPGRSSPTRSSTPASSPSWRSASPTGSAPDAAFPRYPEADGRVKTSAAWLIDKAGFAKGHARGPVRISTKHTLALTNPGRRPHRGSPGAGPRGTRRRTRGVRRHPGQRTRLRRRTALTRMRPALAGIPP